MMIQLLTTILGGRFPSGLLVITAWIVVLGVSYRLGLSILALAVGWSFVHEAVLGYGVIDQRPTATPLKLLLLLVLWCGVIYVSVTYLL